MKRNGMCPICYLKQFFAVRKPISSAPSDKKYDNGVALTPPMGWSSWNTFRNRISAQLILETAQAMRENGLLEAGYEFINLDDCWQSSLRDDDGNLVGDYETFPDGIAALTEKVNALGFKLGLYTSNGTLTCEDLPASLGREKQDAYTFAKWGAQYFKYDFCHHSYISKYAPLVYSVNVFKQDVVSSYYPVTEAKLEGLARFMSDKRLPEGKYVSGLDRNLGAVVFNNINVPEDGEYVLTVNVKKKGRYEKYLLAAVNGCDEYEILFPDQKHFNLTARFQVLIKLKAGKNTLRLSNPVANGADSEMLQYRRMGKALRDAALRVAEETGKPVKPITYSICEWGWGKPWLWGASAGNMWRTTPDIRPVWPWICIIYECTVNKYKYASIGHWNDPDMLEVGNGKLTYNQNVAHFSVWCMMNAPLILGNDLRKMSAQVKQIVTNKNLIAINQDALGKQAKRIKRGTLDVLVKPLADESVAVCFFNKFGFAKNASLDLDRLVNDSYIQLPSKPQYKVVDQWSGEETSLTTKLSVKVPRHSVRVFRIY